MRQFRTLAPADPRRGHSLLIDAVLVLMVGVCAGWVYFRTAAPGVLAGDSGEFQMASWVAGPVHPTGYPLYLLLGYLWTHLLAGLSPAYSMNLFSVLWATLAACLTFGVTSELISLIGDSTWVRRACASGAALLFAFSPTFWSQAVVAEVYTLQAAILAALVWVALWSLRLAPDDPKALYLEAILFGIGLLHHRTIILWLLPLALLLWRSRGTAQFVNFLRRYGWRALALAAAPLALYLYIPLRAASVPYLTIDLGASNLHLYPGGVGGFFRYVSGQSFAVEFRNVVGALGQLENAAQYILDDVTLPLFVLALAGIASLIRRRQSPAAALIVSGAGITLVFNLFYGIGDIRVYYIPVVWVTLVLAGVGLAFLASLARSLPSAALRRVALVSVLAAALGSPLWQSLRGYGTADQSQNRQAPLLWDRLLKESVPLGSILISNDRDDMTPFLYYREVEGKRRDLEVLYPQVTPELSDVGRVIAVALQSRRPVYLIKPLPGLEVKYQLGAPAVLQEVVGPAVRGEPVRGQPHSFGDRLGLLGYDVHSGEAVPGGMVEVNLQWQVQRALTADYTTFVHIVNADGDVVGQHDALPGGMIYPTHLWRPGETLLDRHVIALAPSLGPGPLAILVGVYDRSTAVQLLAPPVVVGHLELGHAAAGEPPSAAARSELQFAEEFQLEAYTVAQSGSLLSLHLWWETLDAPRSDQVIFVHMLDDQGQVVGQIDQQPQQGRVPTSSWDAGDTMEDVLSLPLPAELRPAHYLLTIGSYDPISLRRLSLTVAGRAVPDEAPLAVVEWDGGSLIRWQAVPPTTPLPNAASDTTR
jgi:hypothetical protein